MINKNFYTVLMLFFVCSCADQLDPTKYKAPQTEQKKSEPVLNEPVNAPTNTLINNSAPASSKEEIKVHDWDKKKKDAFQAFLATLWMKQKPSVVVPPEPEKPEPKPVVVNTAVNPGQWSLSEKAGKDFVETKDIGTAVHPLASSLVTMMVPMGKNVSEKFFYDKVLRTFKSINPKKLQVKTPVNSDSTEPIALEVLKIIHDFVASYLSYELYGDAVTVPSYIGVLRTRKSTHSGYTVLFNKMCEIGNDYLKGTKNVSLECSRVVGLLKDVVSSGNKIEPIWFSWIIANVGSKSFLIDPTLDSGFIDKNKWVKKYSNDFLFVDPRVMIFSHFPEQSGEQLLSESISESSFRKLPWLNMQFFKNGLRLRSPWNDEVTADNMEIELSRPENSKYKLFLSCNKEEQGNENFDQFEPEIQGTKVLFTVKLSSKGSYKMELFVENEKKKNPDILGTFYVNYENTH